VVVVAPGIARKTWITVLIGSVTLVAGCANPGRPPVAERSPVFAGRPEHYVVQKADTLYSIAWRYELEFAGLARANGLRAPYTIYPGQRLRLRVQLAPKPAVTKPRRSPPRPAATPPSTAGLSWAWPVSAPILSNFGAWSKSGRNKGVDFRLNAGDRVRAAAGGEVVYAGSGLGGYEHLVIIKHSERYLSAYSLNTASRVREGERVKGGGHLADIPVRGRDALTLHFEIRKDGEAVNPKALISR